MSIIERTKKIQLEQLKIDLIDITGNSNSFDRFEKSSKAKKTQEPYNKHVSLIKFQINDSSIMPYSSCSSDQMTFGDNSLLNV